MEIMEVIGSLVCTQRVAGLDHCYLRVLRTSKGKINVAVDPRRRVCGQLGVHSQRFSGPLCLPQP